MTGVVYVYANMATVNENTGRTNYWVIRIWAEKVESPDRICITGSMSDTELITTALNASIGVTDRQAEELVQTWIAQ
jgi:hypothetical protein